MATDTDLEAIRRRASQRGRELQLPYAGALTPVEAHALLQAGAKLVDVRTVAELVYVGRVPGGVLVEWATYPHNARNPQFLDQLAQAAKPDDTLLFLCRSGHRSHAAAVVATQAGYKDSYNILEGFEGDRDPAQQRGHLNGWRKAGLPWVQG
jgi:rhodanese-related sulfurtransferase